MSIGRCILLRFSLTVVVFGVIFSLLTVSVLEKRFNSFDAKYHEQELARVRSAFELEQDSMAAMVYDYGHWDDAESFMHGQKPGFIEASFSADTALSLGNTAFVFTYPSGLIAASKMLNDENELIETPAHIRQTIQPYLHGATQQNNKNASVSLQWFDGKPFLCSISPITDTAQKNSPSGYIFFLRQIDDKYLQKLQKITATQFTLSHSAASQSEAIHISKSSRNGSPYWQASQNLHNWPGTITVGGSTQIQNERRTTYLAMGANALLLMLASLGTIYWILHHRLLNRLAVFSGLAQRQQLEDNAQIRWPVTGNDELDNLGKSLNNLISNVDTQNRNLRHMAEHDPLTGIGNRRLLLDRLEAVQNRGRRIAGTPSSLLLLDLDGFKHINDGLGHGAGDDVLKAVADRLQAQLRSYDTLVRLGGDEFAILLENLEPAQGASLVQRLLNSIARPLDIGGHTLTVQASGGVAPVSLSDNAEQILRHADLAMYEAKRLGKGRWVEFDESFLDTSRRRLFLQEALVAALDTDGLEVWYQPITELSSGCAVSMEALARWKLHDHFIPPDEFIAIAEGCGLIKRLGKFIIDQVGADLQLLRKEHPHIGCSINLSVAQFQGADLIDSIRASFRSYDIPSSAIHFEITESMIIEAESSIVPTMQQLIDLGYRFYLDDFGKGYSSLDRLNRLPVDTLKIDRSFIVRLREGDDVMVRNIINLSRELGMQNIAEGVEIESELEQLRQLGCTHVQGYYFAKPMPFTDLRNWLRKQKKADVV